MCKILIILVLCALTHSCETLDKKEQNNRENSEVINSANQPQILTEIKNEEVLLSVPIVFKKSKSNYNSRIDTNLLFKAWAMDLNDPSASFDINSEFFFAVDFDGMGERSYILKDKNLKISDENYTDEGDIIKLTKDSLHIKWKATGSTVKYIAWKDNE